MSAVPLWLDRLSQATNYRELQEIFGQIVGAVQAGGDHAALAASIDEAIRRLEWERARDERELQEVQSRYESFRQENKGVVGWFKRHIPFSATRRAEHEHRDGIAGQSAEILGDNLVIARAQMLKERILPPANRKLGERPAEWQARIEAASAQRQLDALGQVLQSLAADVDRCREFIDAVKHDVEAFAAADFQDKEDRQRRDDDLVAARQEVSELLSEVKEKAAIKQSRLKQLAVRAAAELDGGDAAFRADGEQLARLKAIVARASVAHASLAKLTAAATPLGKLAKELKGLPAEIQALRGDQLKLDRQAADADSARARAQAAFDERRATFDAAGRDLEQSRQLLASAQQFYDAYVAECRANQTMPVAAEAGAASAADSPMLRKYNEAKAVCEAAQTRLRNVTTPYEAAKREVDAAETARAKLQKQLGELRDKLHGLQLREPQLRAEIAKAAGAAQETFAVAAAEVGVYLAGQRSASVAPYEAHQLAAGAYSMLGPHGLDRGLSDALVQVERDYQRHLQGMQVAERLHHWLDAQREALDRERAALQQRRDGTWTRRCAELVGDRLAQEACAAGLDG